MPQNIEARLRRVEAQQPVDIQTRWVRGIGDTHEAAMEDAGRLEADLRAIGYAGRVSRILRVIIDPPARTDAQ